MDVDRQNRDRLVDSIRRYLGDRITAFEFDDEIFRILDQSADPTVKHVVLSLWTLYDDCKDHRVVLSKQAWDYCQRLILLLESDAQVEVTKSKRWSAPQAIAGVALLAFVVCAAQLGIGLHLFAVAIPFGILSIALSHARKRSQRQLSSKELAMIPFSCVSEIVAARRRVPGFAKSRYPVELASRQIRSEAEESLLELPRFAAWLPLSPVVLLAQMMPQTETRIRVVSG